MKPPCGVTLFFLLYIAMLVGSLFAPALFSFSLAGVLAFTLLFGVFQLYYSRKL